MRLVVAVFTLLALTPLGLFICALLGHWWYFPLGVGIALLVRGSRHIAREIPLLAEPPSHSLHLFTEVPDFPADGFYGYRPIDLDD